MNKSDIATAIKPITMDMVRADMHRLMTCIEMCKTEGVEPWTARTRIGNNVVDYFTFIHRLETKGKYAISFFEFIERIDEFKQKRFIQTMLAYYENKKKKKNKWIVLKEVYNICISAINIMRPLVCASLFMRFGNSESTVLNCCAGWGGSAVAAAAVKCKSHHGIDSNLALKGAYRELHAFLATVSPTQCSFEHGNALDMDYSALSYNLVFCSPPYYAIERYPGSMEFGSKQEMNDTFYRPLFTRVFAGLDVGGHLMINVCAEAYHSCLALSDCLGTADYLIPLAKSARQNAYSEMIYVWKKKEAVNTSAVETTRNGPVTAEEEAAELHV